MPPSGTTWKLEGHTVGKHKVLEEYLKAWMPITLSKHGNVLFVDAFAGPGEYEKGERGSPIIALEAFRKHTKQRMMTGRMSFVFIENDERRHSHLRSLIEQRGFAAQSKLSVKTYNAPFDSVFPELLEILDTQKTSPSLFMLDPFGAKGIDYAHIKNLMERPSAEAYVSFMYKDINRFASVAGNAQHGDKLFGCSDWHDVVDIDDVKRKDFLCGKYEEQLRKAGAKYVLRFDVIGSKGEEYALFFATQNAQGCDKMKQAMWKVDPRGTYGFKSGMDSQLVFGQKDGLLDDAQIGRDVVGNFGKDRFVSIDEIDAFMRSDATMFHSGQYKKVLKGMEERGEIEIRDPGGKRRKGDFPTRREISLRFAAPPAQTAWQQSMQLFC